MATVLKTVMGASPSRVQIPAPPPRLAVNLSLGPLAALMRCEGWPARVARAARGDERVAETLELLVGSRRLYELIDRRTLVRGWLRMARTETQWASWAFGVVCGNASSGRRRVAGGRFPRCGDPRRDAQRAHRPDRARGAPERDTGSGSGDCCRARDDPRDSTQSRAGPRPSDQVLTPALRKTTQDTELRRGLLGRVALAVTESVVRDHPLHRHSFQTRLHDLG